MRIEYIDKLKGLAIILVVMGHVLEKSMEVNNTPANLVYSRFHMGLFMFLSGIFAMKSIRQWNINECINFVKKKAQRILVPFITVGIILSFAIYQDATTVLIGKINSSLWFLPALFYCMILELCVSTVINLIKLKKNVLLIDIILHLTVYVCFIALNKYVEIPYFLSFLKTYPFFLFGVYYSKHTKIQTWILHSQALYAISFFLFFIFVIIQEHHKLPLKISGFFAIVVLMSLFNKYDEKISGKISFIGKYSLQIYVFHWFFLPTLNPLGTYLTSIANSNTELIFNTNFILLLIVALLITVPIILLCIGLSVILKRNKYLNAIFFGGK